MEIFAFFLITSKICKRFKKLKRNITKNNSIIIFNNVLNPNKVKFHKIINFTFQVRRKIFSYFLYKLIYSHFSEKQIFYDISVFSD